MQARRKIARVCTALTACSRGHDAADSLRPLSGGCTAPEDRLQYSTLRFLVPLLPALMLCVCKQKKVNTVSTVSKGKMPGIPWQKSTFVQAREGAVGYVLTWPQRSTFIHNIRLLFCLLFFSPPTPIKRCGTAVKVGVFACCFVSEYSIGVLLKCRSTVRRVVIFKLPYF